ncbi:MAG: MerR family transcriptional regulator [Gemmatimonadales bacterium]|nr:MerR family transcriptional regulator [Gemmatimonadales bacterium]
MGTAGERVEDPLFNLREYRKLAPWNLRDLATLAGAILDASGVRPINAAASAHPTERTIRFYVTRDLVAPPEGRGTAATYSYRHLLQVLAIKLRQMEGATLGAIGNELSETTGDVLERRIAAALGPHLPTPTQLPLTNQDAAPRGRAGQALRPQLNALEEPTDTRGATRWHRVRVAEGVELHVREDHPLVVRGNVEAQIGDAVRLAIGRIMSQLRSVPGSPRPAGSSVERTGQRA